MIASGAPLLAIADPVDDLASIDLGVLLPVHVCEVVRQSDVKDELGVILQMN